MNFVIEIRMRHFYPMPCLHMYLHTLTSYNSICCNACQSCPLRLPSLVPPHLDSVLSYYIVWLICCKILKNTEKHRKQSLGSGQVLPVLSHAQLSQKSSPVVLCAKAAAAHTRLTSTKRFTNLNLIKV